MSAVADLVSGSPSSESSGLRPMGNSTQLPPSQCFLREGLT
eukprot:CAMPEP_0175829350 /NCGR_PEP_ID=MMETSP0107_2-20121207/13289_1 /TAXON_ID=195067 ORGANISM="Goniomonas pacifica, Strain CCMP1869" /NCGR_SAMPLE_ID=MMETSP0107_2 /ASSEMBLY_ACC=CAM_ASM_000203 /LENGTH=40 /DNA_ID= /DNA_START= /DNA_END= /DNA_ORIENTATION=